MKHRQKGKRNVYIRPVSGDTLTLQLESNFTASVQTEAVQTSGQMIFGEYEFEENFNESWYD